MCEICVRGHERSDRGGNRCVGSSLPLAVHMRGRRGRGGRCALCLWAGRSRGSRGGSGTARVCACGAGGGRGGGATAAALLWHDVLIKEGSKYKVGLEYTKVFHWQHHWSARERGRREEEEQERKKTISVIIAIRHPHTTPLTPLVALPSSTFKQQTGCPEASQNDMIALNSFRQKVTIVSCCMSKSSKSLL